MVLTQTVLRPVQRSTTSFRLVTKQEVPLQINNSNSQSPYKLLNESIKLPTPRGPQLSQCRGCLAMTANVNIFSTVIVDNLSLAKIIDFCANETICENDSLPSQLCKLCVEKFLEIYDFIKKFKNAQLKLQELFNKQLPAIDDVFSTNDCDEMEVKKDPKTFKEKYKMLGRVYSQLCDVVLENSNLLKMGLENKKRKGVIASETEALESVKCEEIPNTISTDINSENNCTVASNPPVSTEEGDKSVSENILENPDLTLSTEITLKESPSKCKMNNVKKIIRTPVRKSKCVDCPKSYGTFKDLMRHSERSGHAIAPRFECKECSKNFMLWLDYRKHCASHKYDKKVCNICGVYISKSNLNRHIQQHEGFICSECGKMFSQKGCLDHHLKAVHKFGKLDEYLCHICGYRTTAMAVLNKHINKKHEYNDLPYKCDVCGVAFLKEMSLNLHKNKLHNGMTAKYSRNACRSTRWRDTTYFQCRICSLQFNRKFRLANHMKTHSSQVVYKCEFCGKIFHLRANCLAHTRIHTGEKPFVCSLCKKSFTHSRMLKRHLRMHKTSI